MSTTRVLGPALVLLCACGNDHPSRLAWGVGVRTFDAVALGLGTTEASDPWIAALPTKTRLELPTYDGSGQVVHPDLLVEQTDSGLRAVLAITPYPYSNGRFENPSLVVTSDGTRFAPLAGAQSPLVAPPPIDHNDDPDLRVDPRTGDYELLYLETMRPDRQTLVGLRSRDLVNWSRRDVIVYDLTHGDPFIVSPAAIVAPDGRTFLFTVELGTPNVIKTLISDDGMAWDPTTAHPITIELGSVMPWHLDVIPSAHGFAMLLSGYDTAWEHQNLYLATSPDLATWTFDPVPLLAYDDPQLGVATLYRSTGVISGDTLAVWYSMQHYED